jgi:L-threonate 2-dehydrogenase
MVKKTCVGLIGVGLLGTAIAKRLLQNETRVIGFDTDPARRERLAALGGTSLSDAAEVFTQCDVVLLSLPTSQVVRKLVSFRQACEFLAA